jgi:peptidyl-prolyl cis-trans isomerase B (cyclophilin B)
MRGLALGLLALAPAQDAAKAPVLRVTLDATPRVWIEGEPFRYRLTVENLGPGVATIPQGWVEGENLTLREVKSMPASASVPAANPQAGSGAERNDPSPAAAGLQSVLARPAASPQAASQEYKIPAGGRLTFPVEIPNITPPKGDEFDAIFLSSMPPAGSEAVRIERCENLRDAKVHLDTDRGAIVLELAPQSAPLAVRNFVRLAESGFYDGLAFHRIAKGNCIQAGDPESRLGDLRKISGAGGNTYNGKPIPLERSRVAFEKGTVALARVGDPVYMSLRSALGQTYGVDDDTKLDAKLRVEWPSALQIQENTKSLMSGGSQFFICTSNAPHFSGKYSAFAKVVAGMEIVEAIENSEVLGAKAESVELSERPILAPRILRVWVERAAAAASKPK